MKIKQLLVVLAAGFAALSACAGTQERIDELIPQLAAAKAEERQEAQNELQKMVAHAGRPGAESERAAMAYWLVVKAGDGVVPQPARVWLVRQLEHIGSAESVDILERLLNGSDAELREVSRRALQKNSSATASMPLRLALEKAIDPSWQIGLISALGERRDEAAVGLMAKYLSDAKVGPVAAQALGKVANDAAVEALAAASSAPAAEALVCAGNRLAKAGNKAAAKSAFEKVYQKGNPVARGAALTGLAKVDPANARKLVEQALTGTDARLQLVALGAATEIYGSGLTRALMPLWNKMSPVMKARALRVVDGSAEKLAIEAAGSTDEDLRTAALETLGRVGGSAAVPVLLKAATGENQTDKPVAELALSRIAGKGALAALEKQAAQGEPKARAAAIAALAAQYDQPALKAMLAYAADKDATVRRAAFAALKKVGGDAEVEALGRMAISGNNSDANDTLQGILPRANDKAAALKKLTAMADKADVKGKAAFYETLTGLGTDAALQIVVRATAATDETQRDGAIRALSKWPEFPAATPLLAIASDPNVKTTHNVLAVQGVARLVDSCDKEKAEDRVKAASKALTCAKRDQEKKQVLAALAAVANKKAVDAFKPLLKDAALKESAAQSALTLAKNLKKPDKKAGKEMAQAVKDAQISDKLTKRAEEILKELAEK